MDNQLKMEKFDSVVQDSRFDSKSWAVNLYCKFRMIFQYDSTQIKYSVSCHQKQTSLINALLGSFYKGDTDELLLCSHFALSFSPKFDRER